MTTITYQSPTIKSALSDIANLYVKKFSKTIIGTELPNFIRDLPSYSDKSTLERLIIEYILNKHYTGNIHDAPDEDSDEEPSAVLQVMEKFVEIYESYDPTSDEDLVSVLDEMTEVITESLVRSGLIEAPDEKKETPEDDEDKECENWFSEALRCADYVQITNILSITMIYRNTEE